MNETGLHPLDPAACAGDRRAPVVVMVASAGGVSALEELLGGLPADLNAAVLVMMHMAPDHRSLLTELLRNSTRLPVSIVHEGDALSPGRVLVAVPDQHMILREDGKLGLTSTERVHFARPSADVLLESAARICGERIIAVVLTGGGLDGAEGAKHVKEHGGRVIVQDPRTAQVSSMPRAAERWADRVVPLDRMAGEIVSMVHGAET